MKRLSLMVFLVAVALVAASAMASAAASAKTVLCKASSPTYHCSPENVYPVGTEFQEHLVPGTKAKLNVGETAGALGSCSAAKIRFGIPPQYGEATSMDVGFNEFSFGECESEYQQLVTKQFVGTEIDWISGTHNGTFSPYSLLIENPNSSYGGACSYWVWPNGGGVLHGASAGGTILFSRNGEYVEFAEGSIFCPRTGVTFTGWYQNASSMPLYVEQS